MKYEFNMKYRMNNKSIVNLNFEIHEEIFLPLTYCSVFVFIIQRYDCLLLTAVAIIITGSWLGGMKGVVFFVNIARMDGEGELGGCLH